MSAIEPYVLDSEKPSRLKRLIAKYPIAVDIYRNIAKNNTWSKNVFMENTAFIDNDDPLIQIILEELCSHGLLVQDNCRFINTYSDIVPVHNTFDKRRAREYAFNVLDQAKAAVQSNPCGQIRVSRFVGSHGESHFSSMNESVEATLEKTRHKPDGTKISGCLSLPGNSGRG